MAGVEIMPSQFVVLNTENIYDIYSFQKKLGEGSFGVVYKGIHKVTKNVRAIKKITKERNSKEVEASLIQEIAILKSFVILCETFRIILILLNLMSSSVMNDITIW